MKILVVGDAILDHYVYGSIYRMSPEDLSIPIVDFENKEYRLGGCLNTAANIKSLCPYYNISVASIIQSRCIEMLVHKHIGCHNCFYTKEGIIKTRIIDSEKNKQLIRLDNKKNFDDDDLKQFHKFINQVNFDEFDYIVVSDYIKGVVNESLISKLEKYKGQIFVDTKDSNFPTKWLNLRNKTTFKINYKEWRNAKWIENKNYNVVVTDGERGAFLWDKNDSIEYFTTTIIKNAEVTGAGDVFLAGLVAEFIKHSDLHKAIKFAIAAATESVKHQGTTEVRLP